MYYIDLIWEVYYGNIIDIKGCRCRYSNISIEYDIGKTDRKDWAGLTTLAGVIIVLGMVITEISDLFNTVRTMFQLY